MKAKKGLPASGRFMLIPVPEQKKKSRKRRVIAVIVAVFLLAAGAAYYAWGGWQDAKVLEQAAADKDLHNLELQVKALKIEIGKMQAAAERQATEKWLWEAPTKLLVSLKGGYDGLWQVMHPAQPAAQRKTPRTDLLGRCQQTAGGGLRCGRP